MSASTVETPSVDRKSDVILLRHDLPLSRHAMSLDGDNKTNFNDQQKIGETFVHLKSKKFSRS